MRLPTLGLTAVLLASSTTLACIPKPFSDFENNIIYRPPPDHASWGTIYGRSLQLNDGSLYVRLFPTVVGHTSPFLLTQYDSLVTWENYLPEPPQVTFPVLKSEDGGASWYSHLNVSDQVHDWGLRYQPHFYRLQNDVGSFGAGTILLSGMAVREDLSEAWLDVYVSVDEGDSWTFQSSVAYAPGPLTTGNGNKAVWEPFFVEHDGELICYYSDQRDEDHAQKLVHVVTTDLENWSEPVDDEASDVFGYRPGMTTVAHIESTGQWIMTYEVCDGPVPGCPSFFKVAADPREFRTVEGQLLVSGAEGRTSGSSPFVIWTKDESRDDGSGIILLSTSNSENVWVNEDAADPDGWREFPAKQRSSHSRCLEIIDVQGEKKLMITSAGWMSSGADNYVAVAVIDVPTYDGANP